MKAAPTLRNLTMTRFFAAMLAVWMSGIVFLFCCGMPEAQAAESMDSCPLAKMGACDKAAGQGSPSANETLQSEGSTFNGDPLNCCAFLPQIFDKVRKIEKSPQIADMPQKVFVDTAAFVAIKTQQKTFLAYYPPLLDRQGTYLKNRVFRI